MITYVFISSDPVAFFNVCGYITNSQCDQLPDGLIAQLVELCTGIAEVMGSNPVQAWIKFADTHLYTWVEKGTV